MKTLLLLALLALTNAQYLDFAAVDGRNAYRINSQANVLSFYPIPTLPSNEILESLATLPFGPESAPLVSTSNNLNIYTLTANGSLNRIRPITGCPDLQKSNPAQAIAVNPADGTLAVVTIIPGTTTNYYVIDLFTGACSAKNRLTLPGANQPDLTSVGIAYRFNSDASVTLFLINGNSLYTVNPNGGVLNVVGRLGFDTASGVGSFSVFYDTVPYGIATIYNISTNSSQGYTVDLSTGLATKLRDVINISNLPSNILGSAILNNPFPAGVYNFSNGIGSGSGNTGNNGGSTSGNSGTNGSNGGSSNGGSGTNGGSNTGTGNTSGTNGGNNGGSGTNGGNGGSGSTNGGNNGNGGTQIVTASAGAGTNVGTFTATIGNPIASGSASTTAQRQTQYGGSTDTVAASFFPQTTTYTKTIAGYQGTAGPNTGVATVTVGNPGVTERFTTTIGVSASGQSTTVPATVDVDGGIFTATVTAQGSAGTVTATAIFGGVDRVTIPSQINYDGNANTAASAITTNAVVTIADNQGNSRTAVATIQAANPVFNNGQNGGGSNTNNGNGGNGGNTITINRDANSGSFLLVNFVVVILVVVAML